MVTPLNFRDSIRMMSGQSSSDESELNIEEVIDEALQETQEFFESNLYPMQEELYAVAHAFEAVIKEREEMNPYGEKLQEIKEMRKDLSSLKEKKNEEMSKLIHLSGELTEQKKQKEALLSSLAETHHRLKKNSCMPACSGFLARTGENFSGYISYAAQRQEKALSTLDLERTDDSGYKTDKMKKDNLESLKNQKK